MPAARRWLPFACAAAIVSTALLVADTPLPDLLRFAAYAGLAVLLPGTLVYRVLRRRPHTFVEDVAMGAAVGLTLELAAWAVFSALDLRAWVGLWPLAILVPGLAVPRWRRHWRVRGYEPTPPGWSWSVAAIVVLFTAYLFAVFLRPNPILPTGEETRQYVDLPYHLSVAGEMTHRFPPDVPQVTGEPLHYHWFGYVHMAMMAMVGRIDLPVVHLRLAIPALCVAAIVLSAVVGWRISGRPWVGVATAVLLWVIGEVDFSNPLRFPFGTQATFVIWHGMSMIYGWVLLFALIAVLADLVGGSDRDPGAHWLAALLAFACSGAKASTLPVVLGALGIAAVALLVTRRPIPRSLIAAIAIVVAAEVFAIAALFRFQPYGMTAGFFDGLAPYWADPAQARPAWMQTLVVAGVWAAFVVNMESRVAGVVPLVWIRRAGLRPTEWFLLGGAVAGPVFYLCLTSVHGQYFTRAGFTFGVVLSAWGYALTCDRSRLTRRAAMALGALAVAFVAALVAAQLLFAGPVPGSQGPTGRIQPILRWSAILLGGGTVAAILWMVGRRRWPALRGRGALVTLTAVLLAGAPGLVMDAHRPADRPNYPIVVLPRARIEAARWVRDHSQPDDVLATNVHCRAEPGPSCDPRSFWLSAYAERSVLVEGWAFAPRMFGAPSSAFWDPERLRLNDEAFIAPTRDTLEHLRRRHGVRWLVVDRAVTRESDRLAELAPRRFDNGRVAVYELGSRPGG